MGNRSGAVVIEIRTASIRSWLCPRSSRALSAELSAKLAKRFKGKEGLFITLTYARDGYAGPLDLYRAQAEGRHVREFIRRLGAFWGVSLRGKWIRKMEFQSAGGEHWIHWHLLIETPRKIANSTCSALWGHGFVNVKKITASRLPYFAKYVSKSSQVPAWILTERARSVKCVAVSPGFWGVRSGRKRKTAARRRKRSCVYVPLGVKLLRARCSLSLRDEAGVVRTVKGLDLGSAIDVLLRAGAALVPCGSRGVVVEGLGLADAVEVIKAAAGERAGGRDSGRPPLNLRNTSNPRTGDDFDAYLPRFLEAVGAAEWGRAVLPGGVRRGQLDAEAA